MSSHRPALAYRRMPIEIESPEQLGYGTIRHNLTESSVTDLRIEDLDLDASALGRLTLAYGDHLGDPRLRELVAALPGAGSIAPHDVMVTPGAAAALFLVSTALLGPGSHHLVIAPNYATNIETPRAIGADVELVPLDPDDGWSLDLDRLRASLRPDTRIVSVTYPHNPTGATIDVATLRALIDLVEAHPTATLVFDETYRELDPHPLPMVGSLSSRVVSVCSLSKAYGAPGIRTGWTVCTDPALQELLLAAKEQVLICGSVVDEALAARVLERRDHLLPAILERSARHRAMVATWLDHHPHLSGHAPSSGVVAFPWISNPSIDVETFHHTLNDEHATHVGPGHWFDMDRRYFRLGFGWPSTDELAGGLEAIDASLGTAQR